jgi:hypothetical protein
MSTRFTDPRMLDKISFTGRISRTKFTGRDFLTQFSFFLFCYTTKLPSTVETCELLLVSYNSQNKTAQPSNTNYKCTSSTELTSATCYAGLYMTCSSMHISCYHYPLPAGCGSVGDQLNNRIHMVISVLYSLSGLIASQGPPFLPNLKTRGKKEL